MLNRRQLITCTAGAALSAPGFRAFAQSSGGAGQTLTFGTLGLLAGLDPHVAGSTVWRKTVPVIYDRLVGYDSKGNLAGLLATDWHFTSPREFVVNLREGVTFHGGQPFTAEDVIVSIRRIQEPATGATLASAFKGVEVVADGLYKVVFRLPEPNGSFASILASDDVSIVSAGWLKAGPNLSVQANGTGPFVLKTFDPKVQTVVERNSKFYLAGEPKLAAIVFKAIADDNARVNALKTGSVDVIDTVPWNQIAAVGADPKLSVVSTPAAFMTLWFNTSRPAVSDPRIRRAIAYAVDREAISGAAFFGNGKPLLGAPTPSSSPFFSAQNDGAFTYDPAKAKAILKEAGFNSGTELEFLVAQSPAVYLTIGQIVAENLAAIGIKTRIVRADFPTVMDRRTSGNYDFLLNGVSMRGPDPDLAYTYYFGEGTGYWARGAGFADTQIDRLLAEGRALTEVDARKKVYAELEKRILELSPWVFLSWRDDATGYRKGVKGVVQLDGALAVSSFALSAKTIEKT